MFFAYARKELARRPGRTALAVLGIAVSVATLVAVFGIASAVRAAVQDSLDAAGADLVIQRRVTACPWSEVKLPLHLGEVPESLVADLEGTEGVEEVSGVLELWAFHEGKPTVVTGIDPLRRTIGPIRRSDNRTADGEPSEEDKTCCSLVPGGRYLLTKDEYACLLESEYARKVGAELGERVWLGPRKFEVVGILDLGSTPQIAGAQAFIPLTVAQKMLGFGDIVDTIFVRVKHRRYHDAVAAKAEDAIGPEASVTTSDNVDAGTAVLASATQGAMLAVSSIVVILVVLMLVRSAVSAVQERIPEIGIMKAVGWRNSDVSRLLTIEAAVTAAIGGVIGCLLGWGMAYVYTAAAPLQLPAALASYPACAETPAPVFLPVATGPDAWTFVLGFGAAILMGVCSGFFASRRAARLRPGEALRHI